MLTCAQTLYSFLIQVVLRHGLGKTVESNGGDTHFCRSILGEKSKQI